jgi:hypothetical protein
LYPNINQEHEPRGTTVDGQYQSASPEQYAEALPAELAANEEALAELRRAAAMEWLYPTPPKADQLYPELSKLRYLVRLSLKEAEVQAQRGQAEPPLQNCLQMLQVGTKVSRGGAGITYLVGRALLAMSMRSLKQVITSGKLPQDTFAALPEQLAKLEAQQTPLREVIAMDYQFQGPATLELAPKDFWELMGGSPSGPIQAMLRLPGAKAVTRKFIADRLPPLMRYDAELARLSTKPYPEIRGEIPEPPEGVAPVDALVLAPFPAKVLVRQADLQAQWRGVRLMAALELYRQRQGDYPARLEQLPDVPAEDLQDPFSGNRLIYRREGGSYVLYSVGENGQDDGGKRLLGDAAKEGDVVVWPEPGVMPTAR